MSRGTCSAVVRIVGADVADAAAVCAPSMQDAFALCKHAADKFDDARCQYNTGVHYLRGLGVPADPHLAVRYFSLAADKARCR